MKRFLALLLLLPVLALATSTSRMGLNLIDDGTTPWGAAVRSNYTIMDSSAAVLNSTQTFTGGVTITSGTVTTLRSNQVFVATPTYSGTEKSVINGTQKIFGPAGAVLSMCDSNGSNCTNMTIDNSAPTATGVNVSTLTVRVLGTSAQQQSVFIGNSVGTVYTGNASNRPSSAVGTGALSNFTGTSLVSGVGGGNSAFGYSALGSLTHGIKNSAIGDFAGAYLTDGSWNSFIGYNAGGGGGGSTVVVASDTILIGQSAGATSSSTHLENAVGIGAYTQINSSNSVVFGPYVGYTGGQYNQSFNVGIGTDTPKAAIHAVHDPAKTSDNYAVIFSTNGDSADGYSLAVSTSGAVGITPLTAAAIKATRPRRAGQYFYCSDCATVSTCVSTGTAVFQWALITNKGSACN